MLLKNHYKNSTITRIINVLEGLNSIVQAVKRRVRDYVLVNKEDLY